MNSVRTSNEQIIHTAHLLAKLSVGILFVGVMLPMAAVMSGSSIEVQRLAVLAFVSAPISVLIFWSGLKMLGRLQDE